MHRWAVFVLAHRKLVILLWLLTTVVGAMASGAATHRLTFNYSLPGQPGTKAAKLINESFGNGGYTAPYILTVTYPAGNTAAAHPDRVAAAFAAVGRDVPGLRVVDQANTGDPTFLTRDGRTAYAMAFYHYDSSPAGKIPTDAIRRALQRSAPAGTAIGVTGMDALARSKSSAGPGVLAESLIAGVGALAVLALVFGSMLALLPLVVAAAAIFTTFALLLPLTYLGHFSGLIEFLIALVGLGVAIDYSLLLVTRWREQRRAGASNPDAVAAAMTTAGRAIVFSGATVGIGLLSLLALPVPFLRSVGVGGALIPLTSVAAAISLTPAILGGIGPRLDWPHRRRDTTYSRAWKRWAEFVVRRRIPAATGALLVLGGLIAAFFTMNIGQSNTTSLTKTGPAYTTLQTLQDGGVPLGTLTPIEVLVTTSNAATAADRLATVPGVASVLRPTDQTSNRDNRTVLVVVPTDETVDTHSVAVVTRVKNAANHIPGVLGVTGIGAAQLDFIRGVYGNFPLMLILIAALTFVLLARAFRSLLLPLKAVVLNLVSLAATYGLLVLFWQKGYGSSTIFGIDRTGAITFWIPLVVFAFLFGLSMDYEVFILARIREEYDASGSTRAAIVNGMARTGRLVTSAALILFLSFAALAAGPGTDLKVMATALGFGILLDATIVRSLLVPALIALFGRWNWTTPRWLRRARIVNGRPDPTAGRRLVHSGTPAGPSERQRRPEQ